VGRRPPRGGTGRPGSTGKIERAERRSRILALRAGGASYETIAEELGTTTKSVEATVGWWLQRKEVEADQHADAVRQMQIERLDAMLRGGLFEKATNGNLKAVDRVLAIEKMRAQLTGTSKPVDRDKGGDVHFHFGSPAEVEQMQQAWRAGVVDGTAREVPQDAASLPPGPSVPSE
jgi:hypothetical protein